MVTLSIRTLPLPPWNSLTLSIIKHFILLPGIILECIIVLCIRQWAARPWPLGECSTSSCMFTKQSYISHLITWHPSSHGILEITRQGLGMGWFLRSLESTPSYEKLLLAIMLLEHGMSFKSLSNCFNLIRQIQKCDKGILSRCLCMF